MCNVEHESNHINFRIVLLVRARLEGVSPHNTSGAHAVLRRIQTGPRRNARPAPRLPQQDQCVAAGKGNVGDLQSSCLMECQREVSLRVLDADC